MKQSVITLLLVGLSLAGCIDDTEETSLTNEESRGVSPVPSFNASLPATVTGFDVVSQLTNSSGQPFPNAAGIWPHGDYVFGSGLGAGFFIADISDPADPKLVFAAPEESETDFSRDADIVEHPDGRLTLALATQSDGMHLWNVTDPHHPEFAARIGVDPNHNLAVIPGTELVLNSQSGGAGTTNDLVDASDPYKARVLGTYGTHGCHDITFRGVVGENGTVRAYCAGIDRTEIWNLDDFDPEAPDFGIELISAIEGADSPVVGNPAFGTYPVRTLHHLAIPNEDGTVLIVGDEHNGGGSPGTCFLYDETTGTSTPLGALWFYDISNEADPVLEGWFSPPTVEPRPDAGTSSVPNCTAHFGTLVPGEEKIVMAWYSAGVLLIDFSDPADPTLLDQVQQDGSNVWDARVHNGYVFTGDIPRGMDVLKLI